MTPHEYADWKRRRAAGDVLCKQSLYISSALVERARDCVDFLSGPPLRLTMTELVRMALEEKIQELAVLHRQGLFFPKRSKKQLRPGGRKRSYLA